MQALSDEQQIERLEKKVDDGFKEVKEEIRDLRSEMHADMRALRAEVRGEIGSLGRNIQAMWLTIIFGFAAILLQHL